MHGKTIGIIVVVLVILVGGYFLLRGSYQAPAPVSMPTETSPTTQTFTSGITEISVVGTEFSFSPSSTSVKADEKIKITFRNNGRASHNLTLEGLGVGTKTVDGGKTDIVEFTALSLGTYTFFCSVPGHRASGMEGSLKVE